MSKFFLDPTLWDKPKRPRVELPENPLPSGAPNVQPNTGVSVPVETPSVVTQPAPSENVAPSETPPATP